MVLIRDIVQQALAIEYLTIAAEEQLRQLLQSPYDMEDFSAFMQLQKAAMSGQVRQESRELWRYKRLLSQHNLPPRSLTSSPGSAINQVFTSEVGDLNHQNSLSPRSPTSLSGSAINQVFTLEVGDLDCLYAN